MYEEWFEKIAVEIGIKYVKQTKNFIEVMIPSSILKELKGDQLFYEVTKLSKMFRFQMRGKNLMIILDTVKLEKHFIFYLIELLLIIKKQLEQKEG